jgi:hypothetical protein
MFQADPRGILALLAVAMCLALAVVLYRVGMRGSVARKLALLLVVEAVTLGSSSSVEFLLVSPTATIEAYPRWYEIMFLVHTLGDCAMLALYPPFLAAALQTPMTRPFADKRVQAGLAVAAIALFVFLQVGPFRIAGALLYLALALVFWYALAASIHAWRTASGAARTRARAFGRRESTAVVRAWQCRRPAGRGARGVLPGPAATVRRSRRQRSDAEHAEHP